LNAPLVHTCQDEGELVDLKVTLSYGAVTFPQSGSVPKELFSKADNLMFLSKDRGRNQCHFWSNDGNHLRLLPDSDNS
jgi:GGDEF domain-containing protein